MGNFSSLFAKNSLSYGYSVISRKTKWVIVYFILLFRKRSSRIYKYDMHVRYEPIKAGFFIPHEEWDLECLSADQENDEMLCVGINSDGECLVVQIARESVYDSPALFLKINGHTYTLPIKLDYLRTGDRRTFGNNRLYLQCIAPFRKWKIFFNGLLREMCNGREKDQIVHVRFSFIWVASSGVFDLTSDYSIANIADILSKTKWDCLKPPFDRLFSLLNEYHQPGMLIGTVEIENVPPQEVVLWGCRCHSFNLHPGRSRESLSIFGNAENGFFFYIKVISFSLYTQRDICGYVVLPNGSLQAAQFISVKRTERPNKTILFFRVKAGNRYYNISTFFYGYGQFFGRGINESLSLSFVDVIVNGIWGGGIVIEKVHAKTSPYAKQCHQLISLLRSDSLLGFAIDSLLVSFDDPVCLQKHLTGNIGSSLARLKKLAYKIPGCNVLEGLVVTTLGGSEFYSSVQESISILKDHVLNNDADQLKNFCEKLVEEVSDSYFPPEVYDCLIQQLNKMIGYKDDVSVCIYPSIHGPDSEVQLLEAYLDKFTNIAGLCQVIECIKKCWASQFSFGAVQCKKSTGQSLNIPIAVIVQKSIPFKTSGIITTCDPQTGNPSIMEIREGINKVDSSEINVLTLKRDINNNLKILNSSKTHGYNLNKNAVKGEIHLADSQIVFLGRLACKLEKHFQYPLCIEWCLNKSQIYVIQIRPITVINAEKKSDIIHYHDSYFRVEDEWLSVFNSGEAFLGPISPLGINVLNFCIETVIAKMKLVKSEMYPPPQVPYFPKFLVYSQYHMMYSLADGIFYFHKNFYNSFFMALSVVLNFKSGGEETLLSFIFQRHGNRGLSSGIVYNFFKVLFFSGTQLKLEEEKISKYDLNLDQVGSAEDALNIISFHYQDLINPFLCYIMCTYKALFWHIFVFYILAKIRRENTHVSLQRDFNALISAVSSVEEGDIVLDIMAVSHRIANIIDPAMFKKMPAEDAKVWLEDAEIDGKVQFTEFLMKHGHRAQDEVDIFQKCWSMDSIKIVQVLQNIVPTPQSDFKSSTYPLDPMFNQLSGMPNCFQRLILKYAVPQCVKSLKEAKRAKSHLLKVTCAWRRAFYHLAHNAVKEFQIPFPEVMFFLTLEEIRQLLKAKSPRLVTKALKCWAVFPELRKYVFPIIPVLDPSPFSEKIPIDKRLKVGLSLTGCPMSRGTAVGTAVVATNLDEITDLKKGCVLITYSPSIVWSLFFPILGGFAADVGGMLSDGAVAARECGVPCVINLVNASQTFRTGDRVFIDGNVGLLRRLPPD